MTYRPKLFPLFGAILLSTGLCSAQNRMSPAEARNHVGEQATVCGMVASAHYAARIAGNPTFINLDKPYPGQIFTALIWGSDRAKFVSPESTYDGKRICVSGPISSYRGIPEIVVHEPAQVRIQ